MNKLYFFIIVLSLMMFLIGCQKWDLRESNFIAVTTGNVTQITLSSITLDSNRIAGLLDGEIIEYGLMYSAVDSEPELNEPNVVLTSHGNTFDNIVFGETLSGLLENTTYYIRAFALLKENPNPFYGAVIVQQTQDLMVITGNVTNTTLTAITIESQISGLQGGIIEQFGHIFSSTHPLPNLTQNEGIVNNAGPLLNDIIFTDTLNGLLENTDYFVRAFAVLQNDPNPIYGDIISKTTGSLTVNTGNVIGSTINTITINSTISGVQGDTIENYGHIFSSSLPDPDLFQNGIGIQYYGPTSADIDFTETIENLLPNTTYYIRAFAILEGNNATPFYGNTIMQQTGNSTVSVTTGNILDRTLNTISIESNISGLQGEVIMEHGHIFSTSNPLPQLYQNDVDVVYNGNASNGPFIDILTGLEVGTPYYIRAFIKLAGNPDPIYGLPVTQSTDNLMVNTGPITSFDSTTINITIEISGLQGETIIQYGHIYSSDPAATLELYQNNVEGVLLGSTSIDGQFDNELTDLMPGTNYYIRAFAILENHPDPFYGDIIQQQTDGRDAPPSARSSRRGPSPARRS